VACVDPVETAADKLSAFAWRALTRDRASPKDDLAIVRHLHDLAALEPAVIKHSVFPGLLAETMLADTGRGSEISWPKSPAERMKCRHSRMLWQPSCGLAHYCPPSRNAFGFLTVDPVITQ
jgi:hypothetical protein